MPTGKSMSAGGRCQDGSPEEGAGGEGGGGQAKDRGGPLCCPHQGQGQKEGWGDSCLIQSVFLTLPSVFLSMPIAFHLKIVFN